MNPSETSAAPSETHAVEAIYATGHWLLSKERHGDAAKVFRVMLHAAPTDERAWLALGECHERIGQHRIALELYGTGSVLAATAVRCHVARARVLHLLERDVEAEAALETAEKLAAARDDESLVTLVAGERERLAS
jgi:tetratricopeptide (TPR) repeat protein